MIYDERVEPIAERALPVRRYSVPTLNWVRMPPADSGAAPAAPAFGLDEILDGVVAGGFEAVGLDDVTVGNLDVIQVAEALRRRGLSCSEVGILRAGRSRETAASARHLAQLARATGSTCCIAVVADPTPRHPLEPLRAAAGTLDAAGVRLALEFASYGSPATLSDAIGLCSALGWERCGLLLDSWHLFRSDAPWSSLESLDGSQVALVHLNDAPHLVGSSPVHDSRFRREPPGEGVFDLDRFLDLLSGIGYTGVISLEILSSRIAATPPTVAAGELMAAIVAAGFVQGRLPDIVRRQIMLLKELSCRRQPTTTCTWRRSRRSSDPRAQPARSRRSVPGPVPSDNRPRSIPTGARSAGACLSPQEVVQTIF